MKELNIGNHDKEREAVLSLLAVLHRDGGHYTARHGVEKSAIDAIGLLHSEWILDAGLAVSKTETK